MTYENNLDSLIERLTALRDADPANGKKKIVLQTCFCEPNAYEGSNAYAGEYITTDATNYLKDRDARRKGEKVCKREDVIVIEAF